MTTKYLRGATLLVAWLFLLGTGTATAKVYVEINAPSREPFPLAIPLFKDLSHVSTAPELARQLPDLLVSDLRVTGLFKLLDRDMYIENPETAGLLPDQIDFSAWKQIDALGLVKGGYEVNGNTITVQLRVFDVLASAQIGGKIYTGSLKNLRRIAHRMANEIVYQFTGSPGFFDSKIAAVSTASGHKEIVVMDVNGSGLTNLTNNGSINILPAWARDGKKIAFTSFKHGNPDLYVADLVHGITRRVAAYEGINSGAAWSPVSDLIAITLSKDGAPDLYLIDERGREIRRLTRSYGVDSSPAWSPDGSKIAFVSARAGGAHIYVMDADGSNIKRLTFTGTQNVSPEWSPDGTKIAYSTRDLGAFDIIVMNADGSNPVRVTQDQGDNEDPAFSPDGNFLVFSSTRDHPKRAQLYISSLDGRSQVRITDGKASYTNPDWSPRVDW